MKNVHNLICPLCFQKALSVNRLKLVYHCFSCGKGGFLKPGLIIGEDCEIVVLLKKATEEIRKLNKELFYEIVKDGMGDV